MLTLARAPLKDEKEKQQRLMRIRRVVSHAIRPAPSPPEASRSTRNPPFRSPIVTVAVVKVYFVSCFCDLAFLFYNPVIWGKCSTSLHITGLATSMTSPSEVLGPMLQSEPHHLLPNLHNRSPNASTSKFLFCKDIVWLARLLTEDMQTTCYLVPWRASIKGIAVL